MAGLLRYWRLISPTLAAKFLAGAGSGVLLLLLIHPYSRPLVLDGVKPSQSVWEGRSRLILPLSPPPDPTDFQTASYWLSTYLVRKSQGLSHTRDQLLLLAEVAQAGGGGQPQNAFWGQAEYFVQRDLGNESAAKRAWARAAALPEWEVYESSWQRETRQGLRDWSGRECCWHREVTARGPAQSSARAILDELLRRRLPEPAALETLKREAYSFPIEAFPCSQLVVALGQLIKALLGLGLVLVMLVLAPKLRGSSLLSLLLTVVLLMSFVLAVKSLSLSFILAAVLLMIGCLYSCPSAEEFSDVEWPLPSLAAAAIFAAIAMMEERSGWFSPVPQRVAGISLPVLSMALSLAHAVAFRLAGARWSSEKREEAKARLLEGTVAAATLLLVAAAAVGVAAVLLDQNAR